MSYIALYRKWRPLVFEDVVEQEHVVKTLKNSVSSGRIGHAYLFSGTRGTGKTTMAKIFARAINCLDPRDGDPCNVCEVCRDILSGTILDVIEIDAASNNSVDNVREIRDEVVYAPSRAKYKVYIIDEVHMLSAGAFNALLKTLEEPPEHVVFILATTEPHKLPATILSRCQRFDFRRITLDSIMSRLEKIAGSNGVTVQKDAGRLIARMSDGSMRDAISILDQCISMGGSELTYKDVVSVVGIVNDTFIAEMVDAVARRDVNEALSLVDRLIMDGKDIVHFVSDMVYYYRNLMICKITSKPDAIIEASRETIERITDQCANFGLEETTLIIKELSVLESGLKWATHPRILLEVLLIKLCEGKYSVDGSSLADRLAALEAKIESGDIQVKARPDAGGKHEAGSREAGSGTSAAAAESKAQERKSAAKAEAEKGAPAKGSCGKAVQEWDAILKDLRAGGKMLLYTNLLDTRAIELDNKVVGLVFSEGSGFNKTLVSKLENLEIVEAAVSKRLGREVRIKCLDESDLEANRQCEPAEEKDEFIEKAQDLAKRLNVPLNIIDE